MCGNFDSCGVWVLCLSFVDGLFWLVYIDVKCLDGNFKDVYNYIVLVLFIEGLWSDLIYVNLLGFDLSFFYDEDGWKYFSNM